MNGIGDLTMRLKGRFGSGAAFGLDVRLPTGDEENLLGIGAAGVRPFIVLSRSGPAFSPHINAGYLWNGSSVLAAIRTRASPPTSRTRLTTSWVRTLA